MYRIPRNVNLSDIIDHMLESNAVYIRNKYSGNIIVTCGNAGIRRRGNSNVALGGFSMIIGAIGYGGTYSNY
jgi:hypothetical protein